MIIGGRAVARGYLNNEKLTSEKFKTGIAPNFPNERFYLTGDQAFYLEDGNIEFVGREDCYY
jgi:non-ribosomal peptide synthetase component F